MNLFKVLPRDIVINDVSISSLKKTAIIAHLYYADHLNYNYEYLKRIDENIDIYIITANDELVDNFNKINSNKNIKIVRKPNRGRDFGALLVTAKEIVKQYEYICFIHDKKRNSLRSDHFAKLWEKSFFECLIASDQYVKNIINCFENDDSIGILSCPYPIDNVSMHFKGTTWSGNLNNSKELLEKMNINYQIDKYNDSLTIGSSFWFRKNTLKKLFDYDFKYEDFPEEPMPLDFTIAHILERIVDIVAKDSLYKNYYVINNEIASNYLNEYEENLRKSLIILKKLQILETNDDSEANLDKTLKAIDRNTEHNISNIYILFDIYNFDLINSIMLDYMSNGIIIDGFININENNPEFFAKDNFYICVDDENVKKFVKEKLIKNYTIYKKD